MKHKIMAIGIFVFLVLLLSVIPFLAACTQTSTPTPSVTPTTKPTATITTPTTTATPVTPTTKPTSTPSPSPTPTQAVKTIVLKWAFYNPADHADSLGAQRFADEVAKRTNGRIKMEMFWNSSLAKASDIPDAIKTGLAQLGHVVPAYKPAQLPLFNVGGLPYNTPNMLAYGLAFDEISKTLPALQEQLKSLNMKFLFSQLTVDFNLLLTKPIKSLDDLKGMKIRTWGDILPEIVKAVGAVPVGMIPAEVYEGLQRGIISGMFMMEPSTYAYKWYEVAKYMAIVHAGILSGSFTAMNLDTWNSLSAEDQRIINELSSQEAYVFEAIFKKQVETIVAEMKTKGFTYIDLPASDVAKLKTIGVSFWDTWAKSMDSKGLAGTETVKAWKDALAKYEQQVK